MLYSTSKAGNCAELHITCLLAPESLADRTQTLLIVASDGQILTEQAPVFSSNCRSVVRARNP